MTFVICLSRFVESEDLIEASVVDVSCWVLIESRFLIEEVLFLVVLLW